MLFGHADVGGDEGADGANCAVNQRLDEVKDEAVGIKSYCYPLLKKFAANRLEFFSRIPSPHRFSSRL